MTMHLVRGMSSLNTKKKKSKKLTLSKIAKYQEQLKIIVGIDYPEPIVDHVKARNAALSAFKRIKKN